ncbi:unnamed protein product [Heligmosomoides polygyrus]|uniref:Poly(U)-binding-splicing factor PUF60 n=1 Tax=Heligmosomoides polygyrus TaxID=6339 RepID=A0A3P7TBC3_HELPZ|nr:unnamed protein product [Heligmosomoides polygyrus]
MLGLGLTKLSTRRKDDLHLAKRYAMDLSIKQIMLRQQKAHHENQQKQAMYAQALSLMARVYIGSISFEVREEMIKKAFEVYGPIKSINMSWDPTTGHHKGFAFLEFDVPEAALLAQESMNGQLMGGRNLKVRSQCFDHLVGRPSNMPQAQPIIEMVQQDAKKYHRVYVSSVHPDLSESDLKSVFEAFGEVVKCQLARQCATGKGSHRGFGYIEFNNAAAMNEAIAGMNMFDLGGQFLRVSLCFHILCLGVAFFHKFSCKIMARYNSALTENTSLRYTNHSSSLFSLPLFLSHSSFPSFFIFLFHFPHFCSSPVPSFFSLLRHFLPMLRRNPALRPCFFQPPVPPPTLHRGFGGFAVPPAPVPVAPPPGGVPTSVPPPSQFTMMPPPPPPAQPAAPKGERSFEEKVGALKLFLTKQNACSEENFQMDRILERTKAKQEAKLSQPVTFGAIDPLFAPKDPMANQDEQQDGWCLYASGGGPGDPSEPQKKKKRVVEAKKIQPKLNTAQALAAAAKAGELSDAVINEQMNSEDATLASQEGLAIRGNDARHLLMAKLMRTNRSTVLVLRNMVSPEDIDEYLEDEIKGECSKYGEHFDCFPCGERTRSIELLQVDAARAALDKRFFDGHTVSAEVYDQAMFDHNDLSG